MGAQSAINKAIGAIAATGVIDKLGSEKLNAETQLAAKRGADLKNIEALSKDIALAPKSVAMRLKKHQARAYEKFIMQYPGTEESAKAIELMGGNKAIERQKKAMAKVDSELAAKRAQKAAMTRWINKNAKLEVGGMLMSELDRGTQEAIYNAIKRGETNGKKQR